MSDKRLLNDDEIKEVSGGVVGLVANDNLVDVKELADITNQLQVYAAKNNIKVSASELEMAAKVLIREVKPMIGNVKNSAASKALTESKMKDVLARISHAI